MVKKPRFRGKPEHILQDKVIAMMRDRGWFVRQTHGNAFQKGFPDLYCFNESFRKAPFGRERWIDCKVPGQHRYTKAQCQEWPLWEAAGIGIWIMMYATDEWYAKLFGPPNFRDYWKPAYDKYSIPVSKLIEDILE